MVCKYEDVFLDELPGIVESASMRGYCKYEYEESTLEGGGCGLSGWHHLISCLAMFRLMFMFCV